MTYDQLVTLDAVVKYGSFKAASERLHKSQPSLSVAVKKLEEEFQIQIFSREGYRPVLTREGRIFYEKALPAIHHMRSLQLFGEEIALGAESEVRVGIEGLVPLQLLICHLRDFFENYPQTSLSLASDYLSGTSEKILAGELDIGFTPMHREIEGIEAIPFYRIELLPVAVPHFVSKVDVLNELKKKPQIVIGDTGKEGNLSFGILEGGRRWTVSDLETKRLLICEGMGWGNLPTYLIEKELKQKKLAVVPVTTFKKGKAEVFMIRSTRFPHGPIARKLWQTLTKLNLNT